MVFARELAALPPAGRPGDFAVMQVGSRQGFNRGGREGWRDVGRACSSAFPASRHQPAAPSHMTGGKPPAAGAKLGRARSAPGAGPPGPRWRDSSTRRGYTFGPNTAAMHLAAACRCPSSRSSVPRSRDPWHLRVPHRYRTGPGYVPLSGPRRTLCAGKKRTMEEIRPGDVIAACESLLAEVGAKGEKL